MKDSKKNNQKTSPMPRPDNELESQIADLESQLESKAGILVERDTEIMDLKRRAESQIQTLEAHLDLLEQQKRTENIMGARITELENQLVSKAGLLGERQAEVMVLKKKPESQAQTLEAQHIEREKELQT